MKTTLADRYRFFREHAGYIVGQSAVCAISLARAEERAEREGLEFRWEEEQENPADVFGDDYKPTPGCEVLWCGVYAEEMGDEILASLGMIEVRSFPRDPYIRVVQAELAVEALDVIDTEREAWARAHEALRPDLYAGGFSLA